MAQHHLVLIAQAALGRSQRLGARAPLRRRPSRLQFARDSEYRSYPAVEIDVSTFQKPLGQLAEVLAQKVKREAPKLLLSTPPFVTEDLHVLIRQAMCTYDLFFYINSDERRKTDCYWKDEYTIVTLPLIRNMIDGLYNITSILQDPRANGIKFRKSGFNKALLSLEADKAKYGGDPRWDAWIAKNREHLELSIRACGFDVAEVIQWKESWPTLGRYVGEQQRGGTLTPHQDFLKTFNYGHWREYSAMAHGALEGLLGNAIYFVRDALPHESRPQLDEQHPALLSEHLGRSASILLCIVTELQSALPFRRRGNRQENPTRCGMF